MKNKGVNKHIHIVKWSNNFKTLILTDGDNKKKLWINKSAKYDKLGNSPNNGWFDCTKFHFKRGGYTGVVEVGNEILFGSDYLGGTFTKSLQKKCCF